VTQFLNRFELRVIDRVKLSDAAMFGNTFVFLHSGNPALLLIIICTVEKKQFLEKAGIRSAASFEDGSKGLVTCAAALCMGVSAGIRPHVPALCMRGVALHASAPGAAVFMRAGCGGGEACCAAATDDFLLDLGQNMTVTVTKVFLCSKFRFVSRMAVTWRVWKSCWTGAIVGSKALRWGCSMNVDGVPM
jgi:hypothetical protein